MAFTLAEPAVGSSDAFSKLKLTDNKAIINHLCGRCRTIRFDLSTLLYCDNTFCVDRIFARNGPCGSKHTKPVKHQANLTALAASAAGGGCHLCALFLAALRNYDAPDLFGIHDDPPRGIGLPTSQAPVEVLLTYVRDEERHLEQITVRCAGHYGIVKLAGLPESNCTDTPALVAGDDVLFEVIATSSSDDVLGEAGESLDSTILDFSKSAFESIVGYEAWTHLRVHEDQDGFWLASIARSKDQKRGWVPAGNFTKLLNPLHAGCCCGKGLWEPPLIDNLETAYLNPSSTSPALFSQIEQWLHECDRKHADCKRSAKLPYRVLDVGPPDGSQEPPPSIGRDRPGEFVTLSYRWGSAISLTTTKSNLALLAQSVSMSSLPATIRDAVVVTRKLGYRFLWVDALCIIQDSPADWLEQSHLMGQIYGDAALNISADSARDTEEGFLKERNLHTIRSCRHPSLFGPDGPVRVVCPTLLTARQAVAQGYLAKRGWILQERALSKRILHWTENEVAWECNGSQATERTPWGANRWTTPDFHRELIMGKKHDERIYVGGDAKSRYDGIRIAMLPAAPSAIEDASKTTITTVTPSAAVDYSSWYDLVTDYSGRQLTKTSDKLVAIQALALAFEKSRNLTGQYMAGCWHSDIIRSLLWRVEWPEPAEPSKRNDIPIPPGKHTRLKGLPEYRVPSFSWASVDQEVYFAENDVFHVAYEAEVLGVDVNDRRNDPLGDPGEYGNRIHLVGLGRRLNTVPKDYQGFWHDQLEIANELEALESELVVFWLRMRTSEKLEESDDEREREGQEIESGNGVSVVGDTGEVDIVSGAGKESNDGEAVREGPAEQEVAKDNRIMQYCLVLHPHVVEGEYYRVGYYERDDWEGPEDFEGWEEMIVKLI